MRLFLTVCAALAAGVTVAAQDMPILTPKPGSAPKINGPKIYGARPGHDFIYRIPCTGERPLKFRASKLPPSLKLDPATGIITGKVPPKIGSYEVTFRAANKAGSATRPFKLVVGDTLALTPPMGWNDWYTYRNQITGNLMREAADLMISSGMADYGYQYVNIDDCWMVKPGDPNPELGGETRDAGGGILPNKRFPDMKGLTAYIHAKGLRAGIYTGPGPLTCAGYTASYQHEDADARRFAEWGFDFLKYDWCSYRQIVRNDSLEERKKPYDLMGGIVKRLGRDVVFNLCQYGMSDVWRWGADAGGQCWRTTGDVGNMRRNQLPGFYEAGVANAKLADYAGPGRWNDPDYLIIGYAGRPRQREGPPTKVELSADEQYSYMSMWSLMAAPLFFSGAMNMLDDFTLNVLCNAEVIDVNQDVLGKQAKILRQSDGELLLVKPLEDGSKAVGLFNLSAAPRKMKLAGAELEMTGPLRVRDVWRQRELGMMKEYSPQVASHGVAFVRVWGKAKH
ncbi:MAG: putative Ig domain-containing protein [Bryobacterales bacterium]|nr:putative Ig domain-containing protein [Bryobacterales bacterium]